MRKLLLHLACWFGSARTSIFAILSIALWIHPLSLSSVNIALQPGPSPDFDRDVLVALYNATDGDNWTNRTNWLTDNDLSTWHGVTVLNGRVTSLDLEENNLTGEIPPQLGNLTSLDSLRLARNKLSGEIPPELGNLSKLTVLDLWGNQLRGPIPVELGNLANLRVLDLAGNALGGGIPSFLGNMTNLRAAEILASNGLGGKYSVLPGQPDQP